MAKPSITGSTHFSHNVIMANRKKLKNPNGLFLGVPGSGKSFAAKRELVNVFLATRDRIIVVDPMGEYAPLVRRLGGQVIEIAPDSPHHLNPMDVELNMAAGESPLSMKADFLLSLCELVVGGKEGLQPIEKTVIDAVCVWCTGNRRSDWKLQKHRCCRICTKSSYASRSPKPGAWQLP